jgi:hypothetical protein
MYVSLFVKNTYYLQLQLGIFLEGEDSHGDHDLGS